MRKIIAVNTTLVVSTNHMAIHHRRVRVPEVVSWFQLPKPGNTNRAGWPPN